MISRHYYLIKADQVDGMMIRCLPFRTLAKLLCIVSMTATASAGLHLPGAVPWPGGIVPYEFVSGLTVDQQQAYLDGLREWELAANVQFIPRTMQPQWVQFKYVANGPNRFSATTPRLVEIGQLTRGQICHEMGHCFGLEHEHQRANRNSYVTVNYGNIDPPNQTPFNILPTGIQFGNYDFESVMHYGRDVLAITPGVDTIVTNAGYVKYQRRLSNVTLSPIDRAHMASLYGAPTVPLSPVVTTTADGGVGSLRAAIYYAHDHPGTTVTFNIPTSDPGHADGVFTIKPTGHLQTFATNGLTIDATTQPGYAGKPIVFVNGSKLITENGEIPAFLFLESNCVVKGLGVQQYPWCGMVMRYPDATGNRVTGCSIGLDATGNLAAPNVFEGIQISDGAHDNFIGGTGPNERNVISGNTLYGIYISGATTMGNVILGNYIGTNLDGNAALANHKGGIILIDAAHHNTIGGNTPAARNCISGNTDAGIWITGSEVSQNTVQGNYIGLNATGTAAIANTYVGMYIISGASNNTVASNVISGNVSEGIRIAGTGSTGNKLYSNYLGTSPSGDLSIPNGFAGATIINGATGNSIGDGPGTGNLISGNATVGVLIADPATTGNFVRNNRIGPAVIPGMSFTSQFDGVWLTAGSLSNTIGGTSPGAANVIAGHPGRGIVLFDGPTASQSFRRNSIFDNGWQGIALDSGSNHSQAAPVISSAVLGLGTTVAGSLTSTPNTAFTLEFFASPSAKFFVGETLVTTDGGGSVSFSASLPAIVAAGHEITATATSMPINLTTGDTSEFSFPVTVTSLDGDNDGLPNAYESATPGLNPANPLDAALDTDGDGFTNLQEFVAGTNPNDATSRLVSAGALSGGNFAVSWGSVAGKFYRLERSDSLAGSWQTVALHVAGTGGSVQVLVPVLLTNARQFFRVTAGE